MKTTACVLLLLVLSATIVSSFKIKRKKDKKGKLFNSASNKWNNDLGRELKIECDEKKGDGIFQVRSTFHEKERDRQFRWKCHSVSKKPMADCSWSNEINDYQQSMLFMCEPNFVITGISSVHDKKKQDRKWKIKCCRANNHFTRACKISDTINKFGKAFFHSVKDACSDPGVMTGLASEINHDKIKDREWKILECAYANEESCSSKCNHFQQAKLKKKSRRRKHKRKHKHKHRKNNDDDDEDDDYDDEEESAPDDLKSKLQEHRRKYLRHRGKRRSHHFKTGTYDEEEGGERERSRHSSHRHHYHSQRHRNHRESDREEWSHDRREHHQFKEPDKETDRELGHLPTNPRLPSSPRTTSPGRLNLPFQTNPSRNDLVRPVVPGVANPGIPNPVKPVINRPVLPGRANPAIPGATNPANLVKPVGTMKPIVSPIESSPPRRQRQRTKPVQPGQSFYGQQPQHVQPLSQLPTNVFPVHDPRKDVHINPFDHLRQMTEWPPNNYIYSGQNLNNVFSRYLGPGQSGNPFDKLSGVTVRPVQVHYKEPVHSNQQPYGDIVLDPSGLLSHPTNVPPPINAPPYPSWSDYDLRAKYNHVLDQLRGIHAPLYGRDINIAHDPLHSSYEQLLNKIKGITHHVHYSAPVDDMLGNYDDIHTRYNRLLEQLDGTPAQVHHHVPLFETDHEDMHQRLLNKIHESPTHIHFHLPGDHLTKDQNHNLDRLLDNFPRHPASIHYHMPASFDTRLDRVPDRHPVHIHYGSPLQRRPFHSDLGYREKYRQLVDKLRTIHKKD